MKEPKFIKTKLLRFYNYSRNPHYIRPTYVDWNYLIIKGWSKYQPLPDKFTAYLENGKVLILSLLIFSNDFYLKFNYSKL